MVGVWVEQGAKSQESERGSTTKTPQTQRDRQGTTGEKENTEI